MPTLRQTTLVHAAVRDTAAFPEAADELFNHGVSAVAVVDAEERVVGLFTDDDLLRGLFPGYVADLRHTAFLDLDSAAVRATLDKVRAAPVSKYMRAPMTVELDTSAFHVAERFLHCEWGAIAVVENGRFVGIVDQVEFCRVLMRGLAARDA